MPFLRLDSEAEPQPELRQVDANTFELMTGFRYRDPGTGRVVTVPAHEAKLDTTDLASVPWLLWSLIASHGRQTLPALLHDHLCVQAEGAADADKWALRREADRLFAVALREKKVGALKELLFWSAVSWNRYMTFRRGWGVVFAAQCAVFGLLTLVVPALLPLGQGALALLAVLVLAVPAALLWREDWAPILIGSYVAPLFIVAGAVNGAAALTLREFGRLLRRLLLWRGIETPVPDITPFRVPFRP